ncbi:hypothetical protein B5M09_012046 [Aphanomyces astaci]|uniref:Uncharacterized protein n=1 Tax=Aphanomyces astaci TaxID=112090 RepID=A0A3R7XXQ1_APHAT|nr:hypothetical protein B5M09_012046 [Aphanomyces astaci]
MTRTRNSLRPFSKRINRVLHLKQQVQKTVPISSTLYTRAGLPFSVDDLGKAVAKSLQEGGGLQAWQQWFVADPGAGLVCALKDYNSDMIRLDRKKYSERLTLASAFEKYQSYEQFEAAYSGYTKSYAKLLREVRHRKRLGSL